MSTISHRKSYSQRRSEAYPPMTELADAIYWQSRGDNKPMEAYLQKVHLVKTRHPKG